MTYQDFISGKPFTVNGKWKESIFRNMGNSIETKPINSIENWTWHCECPTADEHGFKIVAHGIKVNDIEGLIKHENSFTINTTRAIDELREKYLHLLPQSKQNLTPSDYLWVRF